MQPNSATPIHLSMAFGMALLTLSATGCEHKPPLGKVFGTVTYRGQPVSEGLIVFHDPGQGVHMTAQLQQDGSYKVVRADGEGLPVGTYQVAVTPPPTDLPVGYSSKAPAPRKYVNIPQQFRSGATSGLTLKVEGEAHQFDVKM